MSLLWCDSFESYNNSDLTNTLYKMYHCIHTVYEFLIDTTYKRTGSQSVNLRYGNNMLYYFKEPLAGDQCFAGFGFFIKSGTVQEGDILQFFSSSGLELSLRINSSGNLVVTRYPTVTILTGTKTLTPQTWYFIEIKITVTNSTDPSDIIVKVDGETDIDCGSGIDACSSTTSLNYIGFIATGVSQSQNFDDVYICDNQGVRNNSFLGKCRVSFQQPNGNGNVSQWDGSDGNQTDNYALVDETHLDDSDYLEAQNVNEKDLFAYSNLTESDIGSIRGVKIGGYLKKMDAGVREIKNVTRIDSSDYDSDTIYTNIGIQPFVTLFEVSPKTSSLWTQSEFNGAEFGVKVSM